DFQTYAGQWMGYEPEPFEFGFVVEFDADSGFAQALEQRFSVGGLVESGESDGVHASTSPPSGKNQLTAASCEVADRRQAELVSRHRDTGQLAGRAGRVQHLADIRRLELFSKQRTICAISICRVC